MIGLWPLVLIPALVGNGLAKEAKADTDPKGRLVIDGGGKPSAAVYKKTLALAGGPKAKVVVIPQASDLATSGPKVASRWRDVGAQDVTILDISDAKAAVEVVNGADLIWIGGGDQERLMKRLKGTGVPEAILARYRDGATVGGASAGAAVMSKVMISRGGEEFPMPLANYPLFGEGLGLWPSVIVDQHFLKLRRTDRLKRAIAEYPEYLGVGIDESTAVIVSGNTFEVVGDSSVFVVDARVSEAKLPTLKAASGGGGDGPPPVVPASGPKTATLNPGMIFDLDRGIIPEQVAEKR